MDKIIGFPINSKGYGTIPKTAMLDKRIGAIGKAVYAYFCSYTGCGNTCFPTRDKICYDLDISKDTLTKYLKQLSDCGYIKVEQQKENGKFANNVYTLLATILPCPIISDAEKTVSEKTVSENFAPNNNNINNNNINNINRQEENFRSGKNPDKEEKDTGYEKIKIIKEFTNNAELKNTIIDFFVMRKNKGKKTTAQELKYILQELKEHSNGNEKEMINILNFHISKGWFNLNYQAYANSKNTNVPKYNYAQQRDNYETSYNIEEAEKESSIYWADDDTVFGIMSGKLNINGTAKN